MKKVLKFATNDRYNWHCMFEADGLFQSGYGLREVVKKYVTEPILKENVRISHRFANGATESSIFRLHVPFLVNGRYGTIAVDVLAPMIGRTTPILIGIDVGAMLRIDIRFWTHSYSSTYLGVKDQRLFRNRMGHYELNPVDGKPRSSVNFCESFSADMISPIMYEVFSASRSLQIDMNSLLSIDKFCSKIVMQSSTG